MLRLSFLILVAMRGVVCAKNESNVAPSNFPDIFKMEDMDECYQRNSENVYCAANFHLVPDNKQSELWNKIQEWGKLPWNYNRSNIHRIMCIPAQHADYASQKSYAEEIVNAELSQYNFRAEMDSIHCRENLNFLPVSVIYFLIASHLIFVCVCTVCDHVGALENSKTTRGKWINAFSLTSNWKKITSDKNPDFQRLRCMQGVRTYCTCLVITCHVFLVNVQMYQKNPEYLEWLYSFMAMNVIMNFFMMLIQIYFVISAWLLTNQVLRMYQKNKRFSARDAAILFLHRVSRFWYPLLSSMAFGGALMGLCANGPQNFEVISMGSKACLYNWWATLFQVTNFLKLNEVCNLGMWSLTIDTQLYLCTLIFLYFVLNYKLNENKWLTIMFFLVYLVNATIFYKDKKGLLRTVNAEGSKRPNFFFDDELSYSYFGFWINAGSNVVGVYLGYLYFKSKQEDFKPEPSEKYYPTIFKWLPVFTILMPMLPCSDLLAALMGPLIKPLFGYAVGLGIYCMSRNIIQGRLKDICENKYAVLLANFTFCTYVFHFFLVFSTGYDIPTLNEYSLLKIPWLNTKYTVMSFAIGILAALVFEQPGINIRKMYLPDIKKVDKNEYEKSNGAASEKTKNE